MPTKRKTKAETYAKYRKRILGVQKTIQRMGKRALGNPRKVTGKSTTLRNMASVTVTKLPNGVVKITGRKMPAKRNFSFGRLKDEYTRQRAAGSGRGRSLKRAYRSVKYNPKKRSKR